MDTIVVAKFKEDLGWLDSIKDGKNMIIYNKDPECSDYTLNLPNVGRESHSYITFILDNWDNLPNVTMFTQGFIDDHIGGADPCSYILQCIQEARVFGLSQNMHSIEYDFSIYNFGQQHCNAPTQPFRNMVFGDWLNYIMDSKYMFNCVGIKWYHGAIFAASNTAIKEMPRDVWVKILESLEYGNNPVTAHYFERGIFYLLNLFRDRNRKVL